MNSTANRRSTLDPEESLEGTGNAGSDENPVSTIGRLNRLIDEISALYHRAGTKMGFADSDMAILYTLCDHGHGLTQSDIISVTGMSKQTVNSSVSRMVKAGWLALGQKIHHRREIVFTKKGQEISDQIMRPFMEMEEHLFDSWSAEERETYLLLHRRYRDALEAMVEAMPVRKCVRGGYSDEDTADL